MYPEKLVKTKIYVGYYLSSSDHGKYICVESSQHIIMLKDLPPVPDSAWLYVRIEKCSWDMTPAVAENIQRQYLSWPGSDDEYLLLTNLKLQQ